MMTGASGAFNAVVFWTAAIYIVVSGMKTAAQEKPSQPLQIWEVAKQSFGGTLSTRTILVYKFQVGYAVKCIAVFYPGSDGVTTLGDVPCEK